MCQSAKTSADRQFRRCCQVIASSCLLLFIICSRLAAQYPNGLLSLVLDGCAGAFFFAELISVGLLILHIRDEFQRILLTRSFLWATVITMGFTTIWGFIELHSHGTIPHLPTIFLPIVLICVTAAAKLLIFRQHRSPVE